MGKIWHWPSLGDVEEDWWHTRVENISYTETKDLQDCPAGRIIIM